jgi:hypothetical protein
MVDRSAATGGFVGASPSRPRMTPAFARAAVGRFVAELAGGAQVVELGAGTGLLTGQLHRARLAVLAVEAQAEPVRHLRRVLPLVAAARGRADGVPLRSAWFDAVVRSWSGPAGTPIDAVDGDQLSEVPVPGTVASEMLRLVRPDGIVALFINQRSGEQVAASRPDPIDQALLGAGMDRLVAQSWPRSGDPADGVTELRLLRPR